MWGWGLTLSALCFLVYEPPSQGGPQIPQGQMALYESLPLLDLSLLVRYTGCSSILASRPCGWTTFPNVAVMRGKVLHATRTVSVSTLMQLPSLGNKRVVGFFQDRSTNLWPVGLAAGAAAPTGGIGNAGCRICQVRRTGGCQEASSTMLSSVAMGTLGPSLGNYEPIGWAHLPPALGSPLFHAPGFAKSIW